ncbi:PaaI family thioesterase [Sphingomonas sp. CJ99]
MILPPYAETLGVQLVPGDANGPPQLILPFADHVLGRPGFLHGGAIGGLLEIAAVVALRHALGDADSRAKQINVTVDFMRGGRDKPTHAVGIVTRLGSRIANVEAIAWQDDRSQPIAAARMNYRLGD